MRKVYPSDINHGQFEPIRELMENACKKPRSHTVDLHEMFSTILYLLKSGCQWRMLSSDFLKWRAAHHYFSLWSEKPESEANLLE
jgi:transposase